MSIPPKVIKAKYSMLKLKNKQRSAARWFLLVGLFFGIAVSLTFFNHNFLSGNWAVTLIGFFLMTASWATAFIFAKRAKKLESLVNGDTLIAQWKLCDEQKLNYSIYMRTTSLAKNKILMWIISMLFVVILIPFLFFLEGEEIWGFLLILVAVLLTIFLFSRFMPYYYYSRNLKGDGQVLIGSKYAYVNGYFHNWDFPLSGLKKLKAISQPFEGISLTYYYTDRTWRNEHTLNIPVEKGADAKSLIEQIKQGN